MDTKSTKDCSKFKLLGSNRTINLNHVKHLAKSMKENPHLFEVRPILVNKNMFVIDGQHRLQAAKINNQPVYYTVYDGVAIEDTRALNVTQLNWNLMDFAQSYASMNNENYQTFIAMVRKYPNLSSSVIRSFLSGNKGEGTEGTRSFREGDFIVHNPNLADVYLEQLNDIAHAINIPVTKALGRAFFVLFGKPEIFDYEYFLKKLQVNGGARSLMSVRPITNKDAYRAIEDAYNHGREQRNHVRFY